MRLHVLTIDCLQQCDQIAFRPADRLIHAHTEFACPLVVRVRGGRLGGIPQLGIFHKGVHAGEHGDNESVHSVAKRLPSDIILPKGKQRTDLDQSSEPFFRFPPLSCRQCRKVIELLEVVFDRPFV